MAVTAGFQLARNGIAAKIAIDPRGTDYPGLSLVAKVFAEDIEMVSGIRPVIETDPGRISGTAVIAGSIGQNSLIDQLVADGRINPAGILGKRETYLIQAVDHPAEGIDRALVIAGSDKRGTIYGIFHISELIGVSPWVYWGDVKPEKRLELTLPEETLSFTSKEPSVRYRGIFLNDEWPSLGSWLNAAFGGFNEDFYDKVFTLILRLKGNFMWPAMWSAIFSEEGKEDKLSNVRLADAYGIVMGTSHHEPMFRAGEEWQKIYKRYGESNEWDFTHNEEAITRFWEDGVIRNKGYESLITVGMRGEKDSTLGGGIAENIDLLKRIITTQKQILQKHGLADAPQVLTLYKEVEKFWYGTEKVAGLKEWDALDDVTVMLAEDNFGNVRTLPDPGERDRKAGWGMYYHVDYHGGPTSYEWVQTTPLEKIWEQMSMAYDYGVRDIWILNVGDLKPMELAISYFLDLAYDFEAWGTEGINKTMAYKREWAAQQFGRSVDQASVNEIASILSDYTRMNGIRKPEALLPTTYSTIYDGEARRMLARADALQKKAEMYYQTMPEDARDAYYQLVYYPAAASANVVKMQIYAGFNKRYHALGSVLANRYADLIEETITIDKQMQEYYNNTLSDGKWQGMMSSPHVGYVRWNSEGWQYPWAQRVAPKTGAAMMVIVDDDEEGYTSGTASLPPFDNLTKRCRTITLANCGDQAFDYALDLSHDWICAEAPTGTILDGKTLRVWVDWDKVTSSQKGEVTVRGAGQTVSIAIDARVIDTAGLPEMTFIGVNGMVAIEAEHTASRTCVSGVSWKTITNYGRTLSAVKMFPTDRSFKAGEETPCLEYAVYLDESGDYTLTAQTAPTNNLSVHSRVKYGVSFDDGEMVAADSLPPQFIAGDPHNPAWCKGVLDNCHLSATQHRLEKGYHVLRFHGLDAGLVLQRLVMTKNNSSTSYLGPEESFFLR